MLAKKIISDRDADSVAAMPTQKDAMFGSRVQELFQNLDTTYSRQGVRYSASHRGKLIKTLYIAVFLEKGCNVSVLVHDNLRG